MDGWMNRWIDGLVHEWYNGWIEGFVLGELMRGMAVKYKSWEVMIAMPFVIATAADLTTMLVMMTTTMMTTMMMMMMTMMTTMIPLHVF